MEQIAFALDAWILRKGRRQVRTNLKRDHWKL